MTIRVRLNSGTADVQLTGIHAPTDSDAAVNKAYVDSINETLQRVFSTGNNGLVPQPSTNSVAAGDVLRADGSWATPTGARGASITSISYDSDDQQFTFGLSDGTSITTAAVLPAGPQGPRGDDGVDGPQGPAGRIGIGSTTSGSIASVTNSGTDTDAVLNFTLVNGTTGAQGPEGPAGPQGSSTQFFFRYDTETPAAPVFPDSDVDVGYNPAGWGQSGNIPAGPDTDSDLYISSAIFNPSSRRFGSASSPARASGQAGPAGPQGPAGEPGTNRRFTTDSDGSVAGPTAADVTNNRVLRADNTWVDVISDNEALVDVWHGFDTDYDLVTGVEPVLAGQIRIGRLNLSAVFEDRTSAGEIFQVRLTPHTGLHTRLLSQMENGSPVRLTQGNAEWVGALTAAPTSAGSVTVFTIGSAGQYVNTGTFNPANDVTFNFRPSRENPVVPGDFVPNSVRSEDINGGEIGPGHFRIATGAANARQQGYVPVSGGTGKDDDWTWFDPHNELSIPAAEGINDPAIHNVFRVPATGTQAMQIGTIAFATLNASSAWGFIDRQSGANTIMIDTPPATWEDIATGANYNSFIIANGSAGFSSAVTALMDTANPADNGLVWFRRSDSDWGIFQWPHRSLNQSGTGAIYLDERNLKLIASEGMPDSDMQVGLNIGISPIRVDSDFIRIIEDPQWFLGADKLWHDGYDYFDRAGRAGALSYELDRLDKEVNEGIGKVPFSDETAGRLTAPKEFNGIEVAADGRSITFNMARTEDEDLWSAFDDLFDDLLYPEDGLATIHFQLNTLDTDNLDTEFTMTDIIFTSANDGSNEIFAVDTDSDTFTFTLTNGAAFGSNNRIFFSDGHGDVIPGNVQGFHRGSGYFRKVLAYRAATHEDGPQTPVDLTPQLEEIGYKSFLYNGELPATGVPVILTQDSESTGVIANLGGGLSYNSSTQTLSSTDNNSTEITVQTDGTSQGTDFSTINFVDARGQTGLGNSITIYDRMRGDYAENADYVAGEYVGIGSGSDYTLYRANKTITSAPATFVAADWDIVNAQGSVTLNDGASNITGVSILEFPGATLQRVSGTQREIHIPNINNHDNSFVYYPNQLVRDTDTNYIYMALPANSSVPANTAITDTSYWVRVGGGTVDSEVVMAGENITVRDTDGGVIISSTASGGTSVVFDSDTNGLVPAPDSEQDYSPDRYLSATGEWTTPQAHAHTVFTDSDAGLVPPPGHRGTGNYFLAGNGQWLHENEIIDSDNVIEALRGLNSRWNVESDDLEIYQNVRIPAVPGTAGTQAEIRFKVVARPGDQPYSQLGTNSHVVLRYPERGRSTYRYINVPLVNPNNPSVDYPPRTSQGVAAVIADSIGQRFQQFESVDRGGDDTEISIAWDVDGYLSLGTGGDTDALVEMDDHSYDLKVAGYRVVGGNNQEGSFGTAETPARDTEVIVIDQTIPTFAGDTDGLVPHPGVGENTSTSFLAGDGTWRPVSMGNINHYIGTGELPVYRASTSGDTDNYRYYAKMTYRISAPDSDSYTGTFVMTRVDRNRTPYVAQTGTPVATLELSHRSITQLESTLNTYNAAYMGTSDNVTWVDNS